MDILTFLTVFRHQRPGDHGNYLARRSVQSKLKFLFQFLKAPTDVLQRHWDANGHPLPPATGGPLLVPSGFVPPKPLGDYPVRYQQFLNIARDYLLGQLLLDYGFPLKDDLDGQARECFTEAISFYPDKYPNSPLDRKYCEYESNPITPLTQPLNAVDSNKEEMIALVRFIC